MAINRTTGRIFITMIVAAFLSIPLQAQNFTFSPSNTIDKSEAPNGFSSDYIYLVNQTTGSLSFKWIKLSENFPAGWSFSLCDYGMCYPVPPDSAAMNPTAPGGDAYFICHMTFNGISGAGSLKLYVYEDGDFPNGDTVTFKYTTWPLGVEDDMPTALVKMYPNPATEYLNIAASTGIDNITVFDANGSLVETINPHTKRFAIEVGNYPPGMYLIQMTGIEGTNSMGQFIVR